MAFGVDVETRTNPASRGRVTDTGTLFLTGPVDSGTGVADLRDLDSYTATYGGRAGAGIPTYDYLDEFFADGGGRCMFAPYVTDYGDGLAELDDPKLGPGQLAVVAPSVTTDPARTTLFADMRTAAVASNRVALRDAWGGLSAAQAETRGGLAPPADDYGATFYGGVVLPGPRGVVGADPRTVPPSAAIAALCNRVDQDGNPNRAAAGQDYALSYAVGFEAVPSDVDRAGLFAAGVNAFDDALGELVNFGFQTNIAEGDNPYWQFNCARGRMALKARCEARGRPFMFKPLSRDLEAHLKSALDDECKELFDAGAFWAEDDTPRTAYATNVSSSVNTDATIAQGELHGVAEVVWAPHTRSVKIELVTIPVGSPVTGG